MASRCPSAPPGVPAAWVTDNNPGWGDPKRQCDRSKLDPTVMKGAALGAYCDNPRGPARPSRPVRNNPCLKVGRATTFGHQNDSIYKNDCWAYHCHLSFRKDASLVPPGALPVALSTKYLKDSHGRKEGVRGNPADCSSETWPNKTTQGACQKCICARVAGADLSMEGADAGAKAAADGTVGTVFKGYVWDRCGECEDEHIDVHVGDGKGGKSATALKLFPSYRTKVPPWNMVAEWQFADCAADCAAFFRSVDSGKPLPTKAAGVATAPPSERIPEGAHRKAAAPPPAAPKPPGSGRAPDVAVIAAVAASCVCCVMVALVVASR